MFNLDITPIMVYYTNEKGTSQSNTVFCHTSGHASKECIEKVCCIINPTTAIIPIHKENSFDFLTLPSEINVKIFNEGALVV